MTTGRAAPLRTCVGCRVRTAKSDLLHLVVVEGAVVPDPCGRLPGRGASLHPDLQCFRLAERRRAFPRAFRSPGPLDLSVLQEYLEAQSSRQDGPAAARRVRRGAETGEDGLELKAGRDCDEHSMSAQR